MGSEGHVFGRMHVGRGAGRGQRLIIEAETHKVTIPERKGPIMVDVKHMRRFASVPGHKYHSMCQGFTCPA